MESLFIVRLFQYRREGRGRREEKGTAIIVVKEGDREMCKIEAQRGKYTICDNYA